MSHTLSVKNTRSYYLLYSAFLAVSASWASAATAYWSFQTVDAGTSGSGTLAVRENYGFSGTPTITQFAGTGAGATAGNAAGGVAYTSPASGNVYGGASSTSTPGYSMVFTTAQASGNSLTGAYFVLSLSTLGLTDLTMNFDVRAATSSTSALAPGRFSAIEYSLDAGATWVSTGATTPTWANSTGSPWASKSIDFSSLDDIEDRSSVSLRFTLENSGVPTGAVNMNVRIDNLLVAAIPEPSSLTAVGGLAALALLRRPSRGC